MKSFSKDVLQAMDGERKYYVYRLIDPRNYETFYVGKGSGNRVFQHANNELKSLENNEEYGDDDLSLKRKQIQEILIEGKEVVTMIHRWNLTEREAFEVEAALIDCYQGLTNEQSGHGSDYGVISAEELNAELCAEEYSEPDEDYVLIKTSTKMVMARGNLYEAVRRRWRGDLKRANGYKYVLAVVNGKVAEVYEVDEWHKSKYYNRIEFTGKPAQGEITKLKGKLIPSEYKQPGASNPFMYKKTK